MTDSQTTIIAIRSLADLIDEFAGILKNPIDSGVAATDAQKSVLGHVRAAYVNQRQIPIPSDTSAAPGASTALEHAALRTSALTVKLDGDLQPAEADRLGIRVDEQGRLNPMHLFEEDVCFGLYPISAVESSLSSVLNDAELRRLLADAAIAFVLVEEAVSWETWMETFAR